MPLGYCTPIALFHSDNGALSVRSGSRIVCEEFYASGVVAINRLRTTVCCIYIKMRVRKMQKVPMGLMSAVIKTAIWKVSDINNEQVITPRV